MLGMPIYAGSKGESSRFTRVLFVPDSPKEGRVAEQVFGCLLWLMPWVAGREVLSLDLEGKQIFLAVIGVLLLLFGCRLGAADTPKKPRLRQSKSCIWNSLGVCGHWRKRPKA